MIQFYLVRNSPKPTEYSIEEAMKSKTKQFNLNRNSPKANESEKFSKEPTNVKDLDDYVLVFNKPTKETLASNIIQIPQSITFLINVNA